MARDIIPETNLIDLVDSSAAEAITNTLTFGAWVNLDSFGDTDVITNRRVANNTNGWTLDIRLTNPTNGLVMYLFIGAGYVNLQSSANPFSIGNWALALGWYDGANKKIYVNGSSVGSSAQTGNLVQTGTQVFRIANYVGGGLSMDGKISHHVLWNSALTANNLLALAHGINPFAIENQNLICYNPLTGDYTIEPDYSGNGSISSSIIGSLQSNTNPPVEHLSNYISGYC